jgi:DNA primase
MNGLLVDLLEGFLGEHRKHNEETGQISFDCPSCSDQKGLIDGDGKGNLEINYNQNVFKCWACAETSNMQGSVLKLLKRYGNEKITRNYLLLKPDADTFIKKEKEAVLVKLPEGYKKLSKCTDKDFKAKLALRYLHSRGITDDIIDYFDIGYTYTGKYFNRIIIPSYDENGDLNYFISRWFAKEYTKLKYLNPESDKNTIIFNEGKINWDSTIYLVEGVTDHIVTPNSIPLLGKYVSDYLLEKLQDNAQSFVVVVLDDDAYEDAVKLYHRLNFGNLLGRVKIVKSPNGYDPSKIFELLGKKGIIKLLKNAKRLEF